MEATALYKYIDYNQWANSRIAEAITSIEDKTLLDVPIVSSFTSLRKTIHHIWDAELAWMARLQNQVITWPPSAQFKDPAIDTFVATSEQFAYFIKQQNESFFNTITVYKNSKGQQFENKNWEMIMHAMNHSTFHRGQIITMLRQVGITEIKETDLIAFFRKDQVPG
jgi:uncharacterized damage-inducible protein DinB